MTGLPHSMMVVAAAPYLALAAAGFTMWRDARFRPRWEWLCGFGGLFALHLWEPWCAMVPGLPRVHWASGLLAGLAYLCLLEFARIGDARNVRFPRWVSAAALVGLLVLVLSWPGEEHWTISLLLGVPSGLLACRMLLVQRRELGGMRGWGRVWMLLLAVALSAIPIASFADEMAATGPSWHDVAIFAAGMLAAASAVLLDAWHIQGRRDASAAANYLTNVLIAGLVLGVVLAAGITVAQVLASTQRRELRSTVRQLDGRIATMINVARDTSMQMADSMSGSPLLQRRLIDDSPDAVAAANNILDQYVQSFGCDVAYVLDSRGIVLASSNRDRPDSLIGAGPGDREYFDRAMAGEKCATVRLGGITRTRGIYAAAPVRDAAGKVIGVATIKKELESLEQQLGNEGRTALVDPAGTIWLATQPNWRYQRMWNRASPATVPASAPAREAAADLNDLPDHPLQSGEMVMLDNEPCEVNRSVAGPQGWSLLSFTPIRPALRTHAMALLATACGVLVTLGVASSMRLRAAHAEVHQHEQMLSRSLKEMERLMSVLSHDLRAPLAAAHYSAEYLLQSPQFRGEAREVLEMIAEQQMRMAEMVSRLLDAIRIRNGAMEWSWGNVAVQEVLLSAHRTVASLPQRSPEVQVELDAREAPSAIYGDAQAIIRLVTNLATNAIRHTTQGSVRIGVRLQQSGGAQWLVIEMADTGGGIAPEVLPLLGRPFVLGGTQGGSGGVGLGLAIAAGICAAHGGKLTVRSEVGGGTTFTAWLRADLPGPVRDGGEPTIQVERAAR